MDLDKFKIWKSGLTEADKEKMAEQESVEAVYKNAKDKVSVTVNTEGWKIIMDNIVAETEVKKLQLIKVKEKDLSKLQQEISVRMEFIHAWDTYLN